MDLIGNIRSIQNRLNGRSPNKGNGSHAPLKPALAPHNEQADVVNIELTTTEPNDSQLGRNIDTTA
jgi:hypothetical protein